MVTRVVQSCILVVSIIENVNTILICIWIKIHILIEDWLPDSRHTFWRIPQSNQGIWKPCKRMICRKLSWSRLSSLEKWFGKKYCFFKCWKQPALIFHSKKCLVAMKIIYCHSIPFKILIFYIFAWYHVIVVIAALRPGLNKVLSVQYINAYLQHVLSCCGIIKARLVVLAVYQLLSKHWKLFKDSFHRNAQECLYTIFPRRRVFIWVENLLLF